MAEKHPELRRLHTALVAERDALRAKAAPLRARRDALAAKVQPLEAEMRDLAAQLTLIERPRLAELENEIAALERTFGARSLVAELGMIAAEPQALGG